MEILLGLVIAVVLVGPLSLGMMVIIRGNGAAEEQLAGSADAQRIGSAWVKDVQNLDIGGLNSSAPCPAVDGPSAKPEVTLATFSWNGASTAVGAAKAASWVAVGQGSEMELRRRYCENGQPVSDDLLGERLGVNGVSASNTIHGPNYDPDNPTNPGEAQNFCPLKNLGTSGSPVWVSDSCTIVIDGAFDYEQVATRRVVDRSAAAAAALPPAAPEITGATGRNEYITVAWLAPLLALGQPAIEAYSVYAYLSPSGSAVASATTDGLSLSADVLGVQIGVDYWVRVQARNSNGQWGELSPAWGPVTPNPTAPEAPTIDSVSPEDGSIAVEWTPNDNNGGGTVTSWMIWAQPASGSEVGPVTIAPGSSTSGSISGLQNGMSYQVTVAAVNQYGTGTRSEPSSAVVPYGLPAAPTVVLARAGNASATVRWTPPANGNGRDIVGYSVVQYVSTTATDPANPVSAAGTYHSVSDAACSSTCEVSISGLTNARYYRFAVRTRTAVASGTTIEGPLSARSSVLGSQTGPTIQLPQPPFVRTSTTPSNAAAPVISAGGSGSSSGTKLTVTVTMPNDQGAVSQKVEVRYDRRSTASGSTWETNVGSQTLTSPGTTGQTKTVTIDNLANGFTYRAQARVANRGEWFAAGDADRWSAWSALSSESTFIGSPGAPTSVSLTRPSGSFGRELSLSFAAPANTGGASIVSYDVTCTATSGTTINRTVAGGASTISVSLSGADVRDGRSYQCAVAANNGTSTGAAATSGTAMPYGECTLRSSLSVHLKEGEGAQNRWDTFYVINKRRATIFNSYSKQEAGLIAFNFSNPCVGRSDPMAGSAYVVSSSLGVNLDEAGADMGQQLYRVNAGWSSSTAWEGPAYNSQLNSWSGNSTGWKWTDVAAATREMKSGTNNNGFTVRNTEGNCGSFCSSAAARYRGYADNVNYPRLAMTFYTQGQ